MRRDDLGRRDRQRHRGACLDQPPHLAARAPDASAHIAGSEHARLGSVARHRQKSGRTATTICRSTGAAFSTSAAARWATWPATSSARPTWRLKLGSPTSVECVKQEGKSEYYFPTKSVIRFDFPARGSMPAVKIFWHDGLKEQPTIPGVPAGEILGDLPKRYEGSRKKG